MRLAELFFAKQQRRVEFLPPKGCKFPTRKCSLVFETLENRLLLSVSLFGIPSWAEQGPRPIINTGSDGGATSGNAIVTPNNPATGAVESIAINPNNAAQIYVGTVNGGIWRTNNASTAAPGAMTWTPLTDQQVSLAIGSIAFDPLDNTGNTLYAGTGSFSNLTWAGQPPTAMGILRTTDGGATWVDFAVNPANEGRIKAILPTGIDLDAGAGVQEMILVATVDGGAGIWRSSNNGQTWTQLSGANGLPNGAVSQLIADPNNNQRFYAGVPGQGVYRGDFNAMTGVITWTQVNGTTPNNITNIGTSANIQLAAHDDGANTVLYAGLANAVAGINATLTGVFRSTDNGANWNPLGAPNPFNAFSLSGSGFSLVADGNPASNQVVYVSGLATTNDVARFNPGTNAWVGIVGAGAQNGTQPHTDSRDLAFLGNNVLLDACDGGLYFIQNPTDAANNQWGSFNGETATGQGLGDVELHDIAWDSNSNVILGGAQDNGTSFQQVSNGRVWTQPLGADGADVGVDNLTLAGMNQSIRYFSFQNLGAFRRQVYDANNATVGAAVGLIPAGGLANFTAQFITPLEVNAIAPPAMQSTRIVVGGGGTSPVYEANNAGIAANAAAINWVAVPVGAGFGTVTAMAYGGRLNGADNAEVLYAGESNGGVFVRSAAGGTLTATATAFPGANVADIALDPNDWQHAFVASSTGVWETTDAGASWTNRTGNLSNNLIQTIEYAERGAADAILVGGLGGVFRMITNNPGVWSEYGRFMPNAVTYDLDYNAIDDVLIAGTFGRGAWKVTNASNTLTALGVLQINGDDVLGADDTIRLVRDPNNALVLDVFMNNGTPTPDFSIEFSILQEIQVNGLGDSDTLIGDFENGQIIPVAGITYNGGSEAGSDALQLEDGTFATVTYTATGPGAGTVSLDGGLITYSFLDPVLDLTVAANRVFTSAIPGAQTVRILDDGAPANGRSRIDDGGTGAFESLTFANPTTSLTVNAGDGNDVITLQAVDSGFGATISINGEGDNDTITVEAAPAATAVNGGAGDDAMTVNFGSLAGVVTVAGGPDTDSLLVNGTAGADTIVVTAAAVTRDATPDETVNYSGIEAVTVKGGAGNDAFTVESSAPGTLTMDGQGGSDSYAVNLGSLAGAVAVTDTGPVPPPDIDTLLINGTPGDDTIILTDSGVTGGGGAGLSFSGIENFSVDAGAGNDLVDGSALTIPVTIFGGTGNDTLIGGAGNDSLFGEEDNDDLIGGLGADFLDGGAGSDGLLGDKGSIVRELLDGSTAAVLSTPNKHLQAEINQAGTIKRVVTLLDPEQGGDDTMLGGAGDDSLHGGAGNDEMDGGDDSDALFGDLGDDSMMGGAGTDHLFGGRGKDTLDGGTGADIAYGGDGDDRLIADVPDDRLIDWFGNFNDFVVPGPGYGAPTIVRSPSPWVRDFLLDLAVADGALDPNGEIVVVIPGSPDQQGNSGKGGRTK
jgi:hypothetical protein